MLARTLSRTGYRPGSGGWRKIVALIAGCSAIAGLYLALPDPGPRIRTTGLTDVQLRAVVQDLTVPTPSAEATPASSKGDARRLATFGRQLFSDPRLSPGGALACASCHDPQRAFAGGHGAPGPRDVPSVANVAMATWFNWDGRSASLISQALDATEDPRQLGSSRLAVVRLMATAYRQEYESVFGPLPAGLAAPDELARLPEHATPQPPRQALSVEVAAHALETVGTFDLLKDILLRSQEARRAPAMELSRRAVATHAAPPIAWVAAHEALPAATQAAVDQVFVNYGRALAAYQTGLVATDSPFDRFARRLGEGATTAEAMATGFGQAELTGLQLFVGPGQCLSCHGGPGFSDQQFHNIGLAAQDTPSLTVDAGRASGMLLAKASAFHCVAGSGADPAAAVTRAESCAELPYLDVDGLMFVGAYKTPSLRNVTATAPYMHDGRFATLAEVLVHYNALTARPGLGVREGTLKALRFTEEELAALEAFLGSLASDVRDLGAEAAAVGATP